jgi:hypothetical protein
LAHFTFVAIVETFLWLSQSVLSSNQSLSPNQNYNGSIKIDSIDLGRGGLLSLSTREIIMYKV